MKKKKYFSVNIYLRAPVNCTNMVKIGSFLSVDIYHRRPLSVRTHNHTIWNIFHTIFGDFWPRKLVSLWSNFAEEKKGKKILYEFLILSVNKSWNITHTIFGDFWPRKLMSLSNLQKIFCNHIGNYTLKIRKNSWFFFLFVHDEW